MKFSKEFYVALKEECNNRGVTFEKLLLCDLVEFNGLTIPSVWVVEDASNLNLFTLIQADVCEHLNAMRLDEGWVDVYEDDVYDVYEVEEELTWETLNEV